MEAVKIVPEAVFTSFAMWQSPLKCGTEPITAHGRIGDCGEAQARIFPRRRTPSSALLRDGVRCDNAQPHWGHKLADGHENSGGPHRFPIGSKTTNTRLRR